MTNDTKIIISAEASQAESALRSLTDSVDGVSRKMFDMSRMAGTLSGALAITAFAGMIKNSIDLADSLGDLSKRTGASVETLTGLRLAAEQSGTSLEAIANGTKKLAVSLTEHTDVFQKLGINTSNQTEALIQLGDVFAGMDDPVQRSALAVKIFGKAGDELIPLLMEGSDGIRSMIERGNELSGVTTEMAQQADKFNDQLAELKIASSAVANTIAADMLPVINNILKAFIDVKNESGLLAASWVALGAAGTAIFTDEMLEREQKITKELKILRDQQAELINLRSIVPSWLNSAQGNDDKINKKNDAMLALEKELLEIQQKKAALSAAAMQNQKNNGEIGNQLLGDLSPPSPTAASPKTDPNISTVANLQMEAFRKQMELIGKSPAQIKVYELAMKGATQAQIAEAQASANTIDAISAQIKVRKDAQKVIDIVDPGKAEKLKYEKLADSYREYYDNKLLTEAEYHAAIELADAEHQENLVQLSLQGKLSAEQLEQLTWDSKVSAAAQGMQKIIGAGAQHSQALFNLNKAASLAQAAVALPQTVMEAYKWGTTWGGPFAGAAMGAIAFASQTVQMQAISAAQYGGGGSSAPSAGGVSSIALPGQVANPNAIGTTATPITPPNAAIAAPPPRNLTVTLVGSENSNFTMSDMRDKFIPLLTEAIGDGAGSALVTIITK